MTNWIIPHSKPTINADDVDAVSRSLVSGWLSTGPLVEQFERELAHYTGASHAVCVSSCTSALHLCYSYLKCRLVRAYIPSFTYSATLTAAITAGVVPDAITLTDCGSDLVLQADNVPGSSHRLVVPVCIAGHVPGDISTDTSSVVLLDSAQAMLPLPVWCDAMCFSFFPTKLITTGEGGAIVTNDAGLASWSRTQRSLGVTANNPHVWNRSCKHAGYNFRMTEAQAALGISQLRRLSEFISKRRELAKHYNDRFSGAPVQPVHSHEPSCQYQMYLVRVPSTKREAVLYAMRDMGIEVSVHYDPPLHRQEAFLGIRCADTWVTDEFSASVMTLPMHPTLGHDQVDMVCDSLLSLLA